MPTVRSAGILPAYGTRTPQKPAICRRSDPAVMKYPGWNPSACEQNRWQWLCEVLGPSVCGHGLNKGFPARLPQETVEISYYTGLPVHFGFGIGNFASSHARQGGAWGACNICARRRTKLPAIQVDGNGLFREACEKPARTVLRIQLEIRSPGSG